MEVEMTGAEIYKTLKSIGFTPTGSGDYKRMQTGESIHVCDMGEYCDVIADCEVDISEILDVEA
jgi:hypothetical protein